MSWFYEKLYPDVKLGIQGKIVYQKKTPYQDLKIYDTPRLGRMLTLDGTVQTTEKDEFIYHEMMSHPLLLTYPAPQKVLVIGGGDGGVVREVLKHKTVKEVYLVEIDGSVIKNSEQYLPSICKGGALSEHNRRVKIVVDDGAGFIRNTKEKFDLCLIDSPDPIGVARVLFSRRFYQDIFSILTAQGMMIRQTGSTMWQPDEIRHNYKIVKKIFPFVTVQLAAIPTYIGGFFSFVIASKEIDMERVSYEEIEERYQRAKLRTKYYNPQIHFASRKLPNYLRSIVQ